MATQRKSGIELLRIFAISGVILLHYNNPLIGNGFEYATDSNLIALSVLQCLFSCSVNIFILITGYFLCTSTKRDILKPISLLIMVMVTDFMFYIYSVVSGNTIWSISTFANELIPNNYFVILYITLYFISPFINKLILNLKSTEWNVLLISLMLLFSLWPTMVDAINVITNKEWFGLSSIGAWGSQYGYNIVNFSLLYIIGAYMRIVKSHIYSISIPKLILLIFISVIILFCCMYFTSYHLVEVNSHTISYHNPLVIALAILMFHLFSRIDISSKIINAIAKSTFACFLIHGHIITHLHIYHFVQQPLIIMILHIIISVMLCLGISYLFWKIYEFIIERPLKQIINCVISYDGTRC